MVIFNENSVRRALTPWGEAVRHKVLDRRMKQEDLVPILAEMGFDIDKTQLSNLLYGYGVGTRQDVIKAISDYLDIPFRA